jgi:hypothetical protein
MSQSNTPQNGRGSSRRKMELRVSAKDFPMFNLLPTEIRVMIWLQAALVPEIFEVELRTSTRLYRDYLNDPGLTDAFNGPGVQAEPDEAQDNEPPVKEEKKKKPNPSKHAKSESIDSDPEEDIWHKYTEEDKAEAEAEAKAEAEAEIKDGVKPLPFYKDDNRHVAHTKRCLEDRGRIAHDSVSMAPWICSTKISALLHTVCIFLIREIFLSRRFLLKKRSHKTRFE